MIVDNFLPSWKLLREYLDSAPFADVVNPVDSVRYPGICTVLPDTIKVEVPKRLAEIHGQPVKINALFMRLSLKGVDAPHQAHTDSTMGQRSLMLYMNRFEHCVGGTSLVRHLATGMESDIALTPYLQRVWLRDTNRPTAWSIVSMAHMEPNRAFLFDSRLMHRAEPVGGFGTNKKNGRLVLTAFYDLTGDVNEDQKGKRK